MSILSGLAEKPNPFAGPEPPYVVGPFRDPTVFRDPATGTFHMLVTAALEKPALHRRGDCLAHLTSRDLKDWKQEPPFVVPGIPGAPECPDIFEWNGWWYLVFSNGVGVDDDEVRTGNAMILDPYGRTLAETNAIDDAMVVADLDASLRDRATGVRWIKARRPELYGPLTELTGREQDTRFVRFEYDKTQD